MTSYSQEQVFIPDGSTCDSCNAIFLDSTSRSIIITNVGTFRYCRKYDDLKRTAPAGCILCMPLLDRHEAESTKNIPDRMFCKSFGCPWGTVFDGNIVFLVMRPIPRRRPSFRGTHWALSFRGHREHGRRKYFWELIFDVAADDDNPAADLNLMRPVELDVNSAKNIDTTKVWIKTCQESHQRCRKYVETKLPIRLIDIGSSETLPKLRRSGPSELGKYLALSYCWGGAQTAQAMTVNLPEYENAIPMLSLLQTIRDAVQVTRQLGIKYLWVDSLCIVQDDDKDKRQNLSQMCSIYQNALLTISAACTESSNSGFLYKRSLPVRLFALNQAVAKAYTTFTLRARTEDGREGSLIVSQPLKYAELFEPIERRAWTLQEMLMSDRLLIYSSLQLLWRCRSVFEVTGGHLLWDEYEGHAPILPFESSAEEIQAPIPAIVVYAKEIPDFELYRYWDLPNGCPKLRGSMYITRKEVEWLRIVQQYTSRALSRPSDKLPALGAIAEEFQKSTYDEDGEDKYYAGLWKSHFFVGLTWRRRFTVPFKRALPWRAPSWSWASGDGEVGYCTYQNYWNGMRPVPRTLSVYIELLDSNNHFGEVRTGYLEMTTRIRRVRLEPIPEETRQKAARIHNVEMMAEKSSGLCGYALIDDGVELAPWKDPDGKEEVFAIVLLKSCERGRELVRRRAYGLVVVRWPEDPYVQTAGSFRRIGFFDSLPCETSVFNSEWLGDGRFQLIRLE